MLLLACTFTFGVLVQLWRVYPIYRQYIYRQNVAEQKHKKKKRRKSIIGCQYRGWLQEVITQDSALLQQELQLTREQAFLNYIASVKHCTLDRSGSKESTSLLKHF